MATEALLGMGALGLGVLVGALGAVMWMRRSPPREAAASPAAPAPVAVPARQQAGTGAAGSFQADLHLCMNILNRVSMSLGDREDLQTGIELLGHYLQTCRARPKGPIAQPVNRLKAALEAQLDLLAWFQETNAPEIDWHFQWEIADPDAAGSAWEALSRAVDGIKLGQSTLLHLRLAAPVAPGAPPTVELRWA